MYYISTADKLTRTSVWREKLEGGIDHIRDVVVHDKLGLAGELEAMIQRLVDTYQCEWAAVVRDPEKRRQFRQFANTDDSEPCIEIVSERGQQRPASWPSDFVSLEQFRRIQSPRAEKACYLLGSRGHDHGFSQRWRRRHQIRPSPNRGLQLHESRRVVCLPEYVSAQEGLCAVTRDCRRRQRRSEGRLSAAQKDVLLSLG